MTDNSNTNKEGSASSPAGGSSSSAPTPTTTSTTKAAKPSTVQHTIATQGAAAASTILLYPLDVVKLRFMSQDGTDTRKHNKTYYTSTMRSLKDIYRGEGLGALFKGAHVAVMGSILAWGVYMYAYRALTAFFVHSRNEQGEHGGNNTSDFLQRAGLSIVASSMSSIMTSPFFLIKTRMQVEDRSKVAGEQFYTTFRSSFRRIVTTTGYASLWRGLSAQLLLGVPNALNYPIYDTLKAWRLRQTGKAFMDNDEVLVCSAATKGLLMTMTHPLLVLKTRMQDPRAHSGEVQYRGFTKSLIITCKREGLRGFYRGMGPAVMQAVPRSVLHTFVYEKLLQAQVKADGFMKERMKH